MPTERSLKIRALNDALRTTGKGGQIVFGGSLAQNPPADTTPLLAAIRSFDKFDVDDDPYGEHDFGSVELVGQKYFWKIDYYDLSLSAASPDEADPTVTTRVLTIMLAEDY